MDGDASGNSLFGITLRECDVSNVSVGVIIEVNQNKSHVENCYFEGVEATNILDKGSYSVLRDNIILTASFNKGIDASAAGGGNLYDGNEISMGTQYLNGARQGVPDAVGIAAAGSASRAITVTNNQFAWGHSGAGVANVVGLLLSGADAMISHHGNSFNPAAGWSGKGTFAAFLDATASSTGSSGTGTKGFGVGIDGKSSLPRMSRGSLGYWLNPTASGNTAVASGVLTLTQATDHTIAFTSAQTISAINGTVCEDGHVDLPHEGRCGLRDRQDGVLIGPHPVSSVPVMRNRRRRDYAGVLPPLVHDRNGRIELRQGLRVIRLSGLAEVLVRIRAPRRGAGPAAAHGDVAASCGQAIEGCTGRGTGRGRGGRRAFRRRTGRAPGEDNRR